MALAFILSMAVPAVAHNRLVDDGVMDSGKETHSHDQHGGHDGHLEASQTDNITRVGRVKLADGAGRIADVSAKGNYAYLASFREPDCGTGGIYVVDIRDPQNPTKVSKIPSHTDSYSGEGSQVVTLDTPDYEGDLLVYNNEQCGNQGIGGVTLVDVSNPRSPKKLVEGFGDFTVKGKSQRKANEIHSAFAWQDGNRAFAVLVDDEEETDIDIIEITDPSHPKLLSETDLTAQTAQPGVHGDSVFLHDMVVKKVGGHWTMLASYWDGGYAQLNVDDPANPLFISDTEFTFPDPVRALYGETIAPEGNGHQAEYTQNDQWFIATDEDFGPYRLTATMLGSSTEFTALQGDDVPQVDAENPLTGSTVGVGQACDTGSIPSAASTGKDIAIIERGVCDFTVKAQNVQAAGYKGGIIYNRTGPDGCESLVNMLVSADIPMLFVSRSDGFRILDSYDGYSCSTAADGAGTAAPATGTVGQDVDVKAVFDGWGYVHMYDRETLAEVDTYAIPESQDEDFADHHGDLSIHEVAVDPDPGTNLAYFSYYAGGFRVASYGADGLEEIGHYIDEGGNNFWGVEVHKHPNGQKYVLASDRDYGLYIFQVTP
jgi:hypothetical protein